MRFLLLFLLVGSAYADRDKPPEPEHDQTQEQEQDQYQDQSQDQGQTQDQTQTQVAEGGSTGPVTINEVHPDKITIRRAPSLGIVGSPSTAEMMQCYGFGGSSKDGAATGLWCRLQPDLHASHRADKYASGGNPARAAATWCSRRIHRQDFDSRGQCVNEMDLIYMAIYAVEIVEEPQGLVREDYKTPSNGPPPELLLAALSEEEIKALKDRLREIDDEIVALKAQQQRASRSNQQVQQQQAEDGGYAESVRTKAQAIVRLKPKEE